MKNLRYVSFYHNKIRSVPPRIGFCENLKLIKLGNNPLEDDLKKIVTSMGETGGSREADDNEKMTQLTIKIKEHLRLEATRLGLSEESSGESPVETPKPYHRKTTSRLPVNPASGSESNAEPRSPGFFKVPGLSRPHSRMNSNQSSIYTAQPIRRPGVSPVVIGNERYRSNSESVLQATQNARAKRMGMIPPTRKTPDLRTVDEDKSNRNSFHLRGVSHASGLRENRANNGQSRLRNGTSQPESPDEQTGPSSRFLRALSSLPAKRKQRDPWPDQASMGTEIYIRSLLGGVKKFMYSVYQVHMQLYDALSVIHKGAQRRSGIERVYENASNHLTGLDLDLRMFDRGSKRDVHSVKQLLTKVYDTTRTCIASYQQICTLLVQNSSRLLAHGDRDYIRTLLLLALGSIKTIKTGGLKVLMRNARMATRLPGRATTRPSTSTKNHVNMTLRPRPTQMPPPSLSNSAKISGRAPPPPFPTKRQRSDTLTSASSRNEIYQRSIPPTPQSAIHLGTANKISFDAAGEGNALRLPHGELAGTMTPLSGESFLMPETSAMPHLDASTREAYHREEERTVLFEKIYTEFRLLSEKALELLPSLRARFLSSLRDAQSHYASRNVVARWSEIVTQTSTYLETCEGVRNRLQSIRLNDLSTQSSSDFWPLLVKAAHDHRCLLEMLKVAKRDNMLSRDTIVVLQPLHVRIKSAIASIQHSPWSSVLPRGAKSPSLGSIVSDAHSRSNRSNGYVSATAAARMNGHIPDHARHHRTRGSSGSGNSPYPPATPLSAALGPAVQATMPSTAQPAAALPQSTSHTVNTSVASVASTASTASTASNAQSISNFESIFRGGFSERADALLSMQNTLSGRR